MAAQFKLWLDFIQEVAEEKSMKVDRSETVLRVYDDTVHGAAFEIKKNRVGYLQVHAWEKLKKKSGYGRAIYSIRSAGDVVSFCNVIVASNNLRAKRRLEA